MRLRHWLCVALAAVLWCGSAHAQRREQAMSDAEVERLRDTAYFPPDRVNAFLEFLDQRIRGIEKLTVGKRQPGREEDIHDLMEQFTSIMDDLEDNLDDYSKSHRDIRKALPKVVAATERWGTALRTPVGDERYNVTRKLALEALTDVKETASKVLEEQKVWFKEHPPGKEDVAKPPPEVSRMPVTSPVVRVFNRQRANRLRQRC